jgi:hypothetical protein
MKIKITKLKELPDAKHPNNIEEGFTLIGNISNSYFRIPTIGERFELGMTNQGFWSTSGVKEIIDEFTFRTYNSIYKYEILNKDELDLVDSE